MRAWRTRSAAKDEGGFTIIELVVALALIAIVATGFMTSVSLGFRTIAVARQRQTASELATKALEHLRDVDYDNIYEDVTPGHNTDTTHPDFWVDDADPLAPTYDVNGADPGGVEEMIVPPPPSPSDPTPAPGAVQHILDPVTVGSTVMELYAYATWVDDPNITSVDGHDYKRVTVVVRYKAPSSGGVNQLLRSSTLFSKGTVTIDDTSSTTTTTVPSATTTTTVPSSTTTTTSGACAGDTTAPTGGFTIDPAGSADAGYTPSANISLHLSFTDSCLPIVAKFSNDGTNWSNDVVYDSANPQISWPLSGADGLKTVYGQVRDGAGNTRSLTSATVTLDTTKPTTPSNVGYSLSCQGSNRTITVTYSASTDTNLTGYRLYRSTDGTTWSMVSTTTSLSMQNTHSKNLVSVLFRVAAYDKAGNISTYAPSPVIALTKGKCT
jgi:prepilin-type N-terminal cleavage/methylation domain-containing protein